MTDRKHTGGGDPKSAWLRFVALLIVTGELPAHGLSTEEDEAVRKLIRLKRRLLKPLPDDVVFIGSPRAHANYAKAARRSYPTWTDRPYSDWDAEQKGALTNVIYPPDDLTTAERHGAIQYANSRASALAAINQRDWTADDRKDLVTVSHAFAELGGLTPHSPLLAAIARIAGLAPKGGIRDKALYERYIDLEAGARRDPRGLMPSNLNTAEILRSLLTISEPILKRGEDLRKRIEGWRTLPETHSIVFERRTARLLDRDFPSADDKSEFYSAPAAVKHWALEKMRTFDPHPVEHVD